MELVLSHFCYRDVPYSEVCDVVQLLWRLKDQIEQIQ